MVSFLLIAALGVLLSIVTKDISSYASLLACLITLISSIVFFCVI